jgi:hypothetical protein
MSLLIGPLALTTNDEPSLLLVLLQPQTAVPVSVVEARGTDYESPADQGTGLVVETYSASDALALVLSEDGQGQALSTASDAVSCSTSEALSILETREGEFTVQIGCVDGATLAQVQQASDSVAINLSDSWALDTGALVPVQISSGDVLLVGVGEPFAISETREGESVIALATVETASYQDVTSSGVTPITATESLAVGLADQCDILGVVLCGESLPVSATEDATSLIQPSLLESAVVGTSDVAAVSAALSEDDSVRAQIVESRLLDPGTGIIAQPGGTDTVALGVAELVSVVRTSDVGIEPGGSPYSYYRQEQQSPQPEPQPTKILIIGRIMAQVDVPMAELRADVQDLQALWQADEEWLLAEVA